MSILSDLVEGRITLAQAFTKVEAWGASIISKAPASVQADINQAVTDVKAAASVAVATADTLAGPIISTGAGVVALALQTAAKAYLGPVGTAISPAILDGVDSIRDGLINELNAVALEIKAQLAAGQAVGSTASTPVPNPPST